MKRPQTKAIPGSNSGFTLIELLMASLISGFLITGLVQIASSARSSFRLQESMATIQERTRHINSVLIPLIQQAGFNPRPWQAEYAITALTQDTQNGVSTNSDRIGLRFWSQLNCFDNANAVKDEKGHPKYYLRESVFDLNSRNELAHTCRYGPAEGPLKTQIRHFGLVQNVESFQALYAEDIDRDGSADQWVQAEDWSDENSVVGVQLGLLLSSDERVLEPELHVYSILDETVQGAADGKHRKRLMVSTSFKGRSG